MDNTFLTHNAMFFVGLARRWADTHPQPEGARLYMVAAIDSGIRPAEPIESWPLFYHVPEPAADLWSYFRERWPSTRILIEIDLHKANKNPRAAWKVVGR